MRMQGHLLSRGTRAVARSHSKSRSFVGRAFMRWGLCVLLSLVVLSTAVVGSVAAADVGGRTEAAAVAITAGMVADTGGLADGGLNAMISAGLVRSRDGLGVEIAVREASSAADYEPNISSLVGAGADVVIASGWTVADALVKKAKEYPNVAFAGVDGFFDAPPSNLLGVNFKEHEAAYLGGVVAGLSTRGTFDGRLNPANVIAFVGGMELPVVERFEAGFIAGARWVNPSIKVISVYAGSFSDEARGEEIARSAIEDGADVVFAAAGGTGLGALKACREKGALFIGVDVDQYLTSPGSGDAILTSVVKRFDNATYAVVKQVVDGRFVGGKNVYMGLAQEAVGLAPYHAFDSLVPSSTKDAVAKARGYIMNGGVTVPSTRAALKKVAVGNPVAPAAMSKTKSYRVYGSLKPRHAPGTNPVRIYKWRKVGRSWKPSGYVAAKVSDNSANSRYTQSLRLPQAGLWRLRAYHPADTYHSAAWSSGYANVTVK
jgi:basic membrane protein A